MSRTRKLVYLTAGAGGMFCGSCMHDNALAKALTESGWDVQLVPTYTPIRTDETDVSVDQVFFGGINVYLQQKIPLLRYLPRALDRILDNPWLIRKVTSRAIETDAKMLGELAYSMLRGTNGNQKKEVARLCDWLESTAPDSIVFTNILIGGCIPELKRRIKSPILVTLQGDDVFLDHLGEKHRARCIEQIRRISEQVDGFIVHSQFFRDYMAEYFSIDKARIHVTRLGLDTAEFAKTKSRSNPDKPQRETTIGYLARLAPQKGLHVLVEAFIELKQNPNNAEAKLLVAGWLSTENKSYADEQFNKLKAAGLEGDFEYLGVIDRSEKMTMLSKVDIFSVPATFKEPKGLYALEAMAAGIPVVLPNHACFPEMLEESQGGKLFETENSSSLAEAIQQLINDPEMRTELGQKGFDSVHQNRNANVMAEETGAIIESFIASKL